MTKNKVSVIAFLFLIFGYCHFNNIYALDYENQSSEIGSANEQGFIYYEDNQWYYIKDGIVQSDYTGLVQHTDGNWYYVEHGVINWNYTGLTEYYGTTYYVVNGYLDWDSNGLFDIDGQQYYIQNGVLQEQTGLFDIHEQWYYIKEGIVQSDYTGLVQHTDGNWYYVEHGVINWNYQGLVNYNNSWYYVENGSINWNYTGLTYYYGTWYYVEKGILNWNYTGLLMHSDNNLYYVKDGKIDWDYVGVLQFNGLTYHVQNGIAYRGLSVINGLTYYFDLSTGNMVTSDYVTIGETAYYFDSQGRMSASPIYKGIDVSRWQYDIDWKKVKASGIDYVMIKAAGTYIGTNEFYQDSYFDKNIKGAYEAGLKIGVYYYSCADNQEEAIAEAQFLLSILEPYKNMITFPVTIDIEEKTHYPDDVSDPNYKTKDEISRIILAFTNTVKNEGYIPAVYASKSFFVNKINMDMINGIDLWCAQWRNDVNDGCTLNYNFQSWQYTSNGTVDGISGIVDMDYCYKYYE